MNPYYRGYQTYYTRNNGTQENRGLLLPFLVGAAVAFPIGYIASNTNKNGYYQGYYPQQGYMPYYQPYYQQMPYPYRPIPQLYY